MIVIFLQRSWDHVDYYVSGQQEGGFQSEGERGTIGT